MEPLSLAEAKEIVEDIGENKEIKDFFKKFMKLNVKKAKEMTEELNNLNMPKMKKEYISKIVDLLPEDASDVNKIFTDVSLDEDETNKILEIDKDSVVDVCKNCGIGVWGEKMFNAIIKK